ncbi:MAG: hypothetical protein SVU32_05965, partial [Candidatus Nanohaloarchaea archaeon]|nr:hypothetical protein [Candidatus Nanohaloarchaea archaeon]
MSDNTSISHADFNVKLRPGAGRNTDSISLGELKAQQRITANELEALSAAYSLDDGFTYDELRKESRPETEAAMTYSDDTPGAVHLPDREASDLAGTLGSLVRKGLVEKASYNREELQLHRELNEEHDSLITVDDIEGVQHFFQEHEGYKLEASHVDHPGKDLITVYDTEQDIEKTLTWEGGERYGIVKEDGIEPLQEDSDLYQTAHDIKDLYDSGLIVSDDGLSVPVQQPSPRAV